MILLIVSLVICLWLQVINQLIANLQKQKSQNFQLNNFLANFTGGKIGNILFGEDIRKTATNQLSKPEIEQALALQKAALEATNDGILIVDNLGKIIFFNQKLSQMWHIPDAFLKSGDYKQALKRIIQQLENPRYHLAKLRELSQNQDSPTEDAIALKDGRVFEQYSHPQKIGQQIVGRVWNFRDVTDQKLAFAAIHNQAFHDSLTNLPNRLLFEQRLIESIEKLPQNGQLAVCFLDLDHFQKINNSLGHGIGDQLLQIAAKTITKCLRCGDTLARWGGDEFTILLPEINDIEEITLIQERIFAAFKPGLKIENYHLHISPSIGIAIYPQHGKDVDTLIRNADAALCRVKLKGRNNYLFYHDNLSSQASELLILENSLHSALEQHQFKIYYQPQVNSSTGEITKMEALLRWQHPELGLISPTKFIPIAEETGLIIPIFEWVLKTACLQNKIWQDTLNLPSLSIAVNLSAKQFQQPNLVNNIKQILSETKLNPLSLELEITESMAMQDVDLTIKVLSELKKIGVSISIDDFGTGYSSLSYLKDFPIQALKIDKSFVHDLPHGNNLTAITTAIIALAHGLNLDVVAEGVETQEQLNVLRIMECEIMQGYLFSQPLPVEDATSMLQSFQYQKQQQN
ncbi:MAG TPA: EAL domain-containing protein [Nostocaceae cyanobacterium]|nr:EAL domain-containing protein [Nostocaceae cyanobacterium]